MSRHRFGLANGNSVFWNRDHKLGISTQVLFPLYEAAKHAFMCHYLNSKSDVSGDEKSLYVSLSLDNSFESDVMKHSRELLLLSSDFGTAWHSSRYAWEATVLSSIMFFGFLEARCVAEA